MNGKERSTSHINEDLSRKLFKDILPKEWVCRDYTPDYGIDMSIELFSKHGDKYFTDGEHIYIQLKSVENLNIKKIKVSNRYNVEKVENRCIKDSQKKEVEIEVIKYPIETSLLETVEKMGSAVPILLVIVNVKEKELYYVCLNDYIEKVIIPNKPEYYNQKTLTLNVPIKNFLNVDNSRAIISYYAKRPKLFALFNKVSYQYNELKFENYDIEMAIHFSHILMRMDVWTARSGYPLINSIYNELSYFDEEHVTKRYKAEILEQEKLGYNTDEKLWQLDNVPQLYSFKEITLKKEINLLWAKIVALIPYFEETIKELNLPTYYSQKLK